MDITGNSVPSGRSMGAISQFGLCGLSGLRWTAFLQTLVPIVYLNGRLFDCYLTLWEWFAGIRAACRSVSGLSAHAGIRRVSNRGANATSLASKSNRILDFTPPAFDTTLLFRSNFGIQSYRQVSGRFPRGEAGPCELFREMGEEWCGGGDVVGDEVGTWMRATAMNPSLLH